MSEVKISAEPRTEFGKGGARRTRRAGLVPAVLYGHGEKPQHIALPAREFAAAIRHGGLNQVFTIDINGASGTTLALPKAIQRDPIKDTYEHVDLLVVRALRASASPGRPGSPSRARRRCRSGRSAAC